MDKKGLLLSLTLALALAIGFQGIRWGYVQYLEVQEVIASNNQYLGYMLCQNERTQLERALLKGDTWVIQEYL